MEKNQIVVTAIIVVLVFASIFLYFVFRPQTQVIDEQQLVGSTEGSMINQEIDVIDEIASDMDAIHIKQGTSVTLDPIKKEINGDVMQSEKSDAQVSTANTAPQTGPGTVALVFALCIAIVSTVMFYKNIQGIKSV